MDNNKVQTIRNLMRPYLTIWATLQYTFVLVYFVCSGVLDIKEALASASFPLGAIMTYHFMKRSNIDTETK